MTLRGFAVMVIAACWAAAPLVRAADGPAGVVAVYGDVVHTMAGPPIQRGVVVINGGRITLVGSALDIPVPPEARVVRGRVVTPGLIDAHSAVGLTGYLNQEQDQDQLDKGEPIQPELRALDSYNPRERLVEWVRGFGITTIHTGHAPGALVSGQTMVVKTVGETVDDAVIVPTAMVAVTLGDDARPGDEKKSPGTRSKAVAMLRGELVKTQDYLRKRDLGDPEKRPDRDLRREVFADVLRGKLPLLVTVNRATDIDAALRIAAEFGIRIVLDSAAEAYLVADRIKAAPPGRPFFIAAGFFLPHVPCYATRKWFDLYPDDDSVLPEVLAGDRDDTPRFSWYLHWSLPEPRLAWVRDAGQWRNLVRSYLACTSFVDAQIGRVLAALDEAGHADDTIVVVWGDHGWHLGEKGITGKNSLWDRGTKVPLIFAGPGIAAGGRCVQPAELLDIYPTLCALAGVPVPDGLEGLSLVPQLRDAATRRERPAITTHNRGNHGIRSERWRYIRYADSSEELYDMQEDPREWHNLAGDPRHAAVLAEHRRWLPSVDVPPLAGSEHRILRYDAATDTARWEDRLTIRRGDPIPE